MFHERLLLPDDASLELRFRSPQDYRLACLKAGRVLVEYGNAKPYEFKSVEKLRYDFQRDAEDALRRG
jgi:hypothetical protein